MDKDIFYLLKVFCAVVEQRSFSLAADRLQVQAPAISKAVARLEAQVGKQLLRRTTRVLEVTEAGSLLYAEGTRQLLSLVALIERVESAAGDIKGALRITATPAIGEGLLTRCLADFKRRFPALTLELDFTNDVVKLPSQRVDIALRSRCQLEDSSLTGRKLFEVKRVLVAAPAYLARCGRPDTPAQIAQHACLNFYHRKLYDTWDYISGGEQGGLHTRTEVRCNSYAALKALCVQGMGIARLFDYQVGAELGSGALVQLVPDVDWGHQSIHAVYHGKLRDSPKVQAFVEHFAAPETLELVSRVWRARPAVPAAED